MTCNRSIRRLGAALAALALASPSGLVEAANRTVDLHKLQEILEGNLDPVIEPLATEHQAAQLATLEEQA